MNKNLIYVGIVTIVVFITAFFMFNPFAHTPAPKANSTWIRLPDLPAPKAGLASNPDLIYKGGLLLVGGETTNGPFISKYDFATGGVEVLFAESFKTVGINAVVVGDDLYLMQGHLYEPNAKSPTSKNLKVSLINKSITELANFTSDKYGEGSAIAVSNNCIYLVGHTGDFNNNDCYNISSNTWTNLTPYPEKGLEFPAYAYYKDAIYVFGGNRGYNGSHADDVNLKIRNYYRYNINNDSWEVLGELPYGFSLAAFVRVDNTVHIIGGYTIVNYTTDTNNTITVDIKPGEPTKIIRPNSIFYAPVSYHWLYNLDNNTWTHGVDFPHPIQAAIATYYNGSIYVMGGTSAEDNHYSPPSAEVWALKLR